MTGKKLNGTPREISSPCNRDTAEPSQRCTNTDLYHEDFLCAQQIGSILQLSFVLILVRRHCRITYNTMTALSKETAPGRDKVKIIKLKCITLQKFGMFFT